jgi:hypothetical protein
MKPTLPICISAIPSLDTSPAIWRQIAPILSAIAEREKRNEDLYPSERTAYNALSFAQYQASKKQWLTLWQYLLDRQVVRIRDIATPPPKPKTQRPTKPPKNIAKPKQPRKQLGLREYHRLVFAVLEPSLIRLCVFLWFADYLPYIAPLCPRRLQGWKVDDRPKTLRVKSKKPKQRKSTKGISIEHIRIVPTHQLMAVLTDKWLDIASVRDRFESMFAINLTLVQVESLLNNRLYKGEIYKMPKGSHDAAFYSKIQAVEIDIEYSTKYISLKMAYELAQSRGCTLIKKSFGNASEKSLAKYGIGFKPRKETKATDNKLLNYFDLRRDIQV